MNRVGRFFFSLLFLTALTYTGMCGLLLLGQNRLLYVGTVLAPHDPGVNLPPFDDAAGHQLGWLASPAGAAVGTVVFFHGNDEQAWRAAQNYGPYFTQRGWRVVFMEYPGYDFRPGAPTHDGVIADAASAMQLVWRIFPGGPLIVAGNSLGAGIAAQAARAGNAQRVLLFVPWDSMGAVAQERFPFTPAQWLLQRDGTDYDSCAALSGIGVPVFITYAGQDIVIPAPHALHLARCLDLPPARVIGLADATHRDWYERLTPAQWDQLLSPAP